MTSAQQIPDRSNFYSTLHTSMSKSQVAQLYGALGWQVRNCTWVDYEIECEWAELIIEADSPILMHGNVADLLTRAEELVAPLRAANIAFTAECYSAGPDHELLLEIKS